MKKTFCILLAFVYLIPSIGFSMDIHFCGNKISSVSLTTAHAEKCECGKKAPSKCCKEVKINVKISDSQKIAAQNNSEKKSNSIKIFREFASTFSATQSDNSFQKIFSYQSQFRLSGISKLPVYLNIHSLLI